MGGSALHPGARTSSVACKWVGRRSWLAAELHVGVERGRPTGAPPFHLVQHEIGYNISGAIQGPK